MLLPIFLNIKIKAIDGHSTITIAIIAQGKAKVVIPVPMFVGLL